MPRWGAIRLACCRGLLLSLGNSERWILPQSGTNRYSEGPLFQTVFGSLYIESFYSEKFLFWKVILPTGKSMKLSSLYWTFLFLFLFLFSSPLFRCFILIPSSSFFVSYSKYHYSEQPLFRKSFYITIWL